MPTRTGNWRERRDWLVCGRCTDGDTRVSECLYVVGDTRDVTAKLPDGSVDLVLTSPPFLALRS